MQIYTTHDKISIMNLSTKLSNELNPCEPTNDRLIDLIAKSLRSKGIPFDCLNRGITVAVDSSGDYDLTTGRGVQSIVDGGHTYAAIKKVRSSNKFQTDHKVNICVIRGDDVLSNIVSIADARNNGQRLNAELRSNYGGVFDCIKKQIPEKYSELIAWKSRTVIDTKFQGKNLIRACLIMGTGNPSWIHTQPGEATKFPVGSPRHGQLVAITATGIATILQLIVEMSTINKVFAHIPATTSKSCRALLHNKIPKDKKLVAFNIVLLCLSRLRPYFKSGEFTLSTNELILSPEYLKALSDLNALFADEACGGMTKILRTDINWEK